MEKNKTMEVLSSLREKTFEDSKVKHVFDVETVFGSVLDDSIGILLTSNKEANKLILQIGKTKINLNTDAFDFLIKSVVTLGAMLAAEEENEFRDRIKEQYLNRGKIDPRTSFCKVKTKVANQDRIDENISYITGHTDKIVKDIQVEVPIMINHKDVEFRRKDLLETSRRAKSLFNQMNSDFKTMVKDEYLLKKEDSDLILKAIEFNDSKIQEIKSTKFIERLSEISLELLNNTKEAVDCHKKALNMLPTELQANMLNRLLDILENGFIASEATEEKAVDLSDNDSVNTYLDSILEENNTKIESKLSVIEEGVMEEIIEEEVTEMNPNDVFDKFMSEMSIDIKDENKEDIDIDQYNEVEIPENLKERPLTPKESFTEEDNFEEYQKEVLAEEEMEDEFDWNNSTINDAKEEIEQGFAFGAYSPGKSISNEFELESEDNDISAPTGTTVVEDKEDDEDEDVDSDFLKRMTDLESTLTGNFEKLEEEIPTFEKIEKLRIDHGELAAKEYVSSLSQEQREHLVKERLAMKLAAAEAAQKK